MPKTEHTSETDIALLHTAIGSGSFAETCRLIPTVTDLNVKDHQGNTLLHLLLKNEANENQWCVVISLLLQYGADLSQGNDFGDTALHVAALNGHTAAMRLLLDCEADLSQGNDFGDTALHVAARNGRTAVVELLLKQRADLSQGNHEGDTALHDAARNGYAEAVQLLLDYGANLGQGNHKGDTALHVAARNGRTAVVQLLLDYGADLSQGNHKGDTALHEAIFCKEIGVVKRLIHAHWIQTQDVKVVIDLITAVNTENSDFVELCKKVAGQHRYLSEEIMKVDSEKLIAMRTRLREIIYSKDNCDLCLGRLTTLLKQVERRCATEVTLEKFVERRKGAALKLEWFQKRRGPEGEAYQHRPKDETEDETGVTPLFLPPPEVLMRILSYIPETEQIQRVATAFSPTQRGQDKHVSSDAMECCDLDKREIGRPGLRP